jgi:hypothetical protein
MDPLKDGIHQKYQILHTDGRPVDTEAFYWVLRIDAGGEPKHISACRKSLKVYADEIKATLPKLADELYVKLAEFERVDKIKTKINELTALLKQKS